MEGLKEGRRRRCKKVSHLVLCARLCVSVNRGACTMEQTGVSNPPKHSSKKNCLTFPRAYANSSTPLSPAPTYVGKTRGTLLRRRSHKKVLIASNEPSRKTVTQWCHPVTLKIEKLSPLFNTSFQTLKMTEKKKPSRPHHCGLAPARTRRHAGATRTPRTAPYGL